MPTTTPHAHMSTRNGRHRRVRGRQEPDTERMVTTIVPNNADRMMINRMLATGMWIQHEQQSRGAVHTHELFYPA